MWSSRFCCRLGRTSNALRPSMDCDFRQARTLLSWVGPRGQQKWGQEEGASDRWLLLMGPASVDERESGVRICPVPSHSIDCTRTNELLLPRLQLRPLGNIQLSTSKRTAAVLGCSMSVMFVIATCYMITHTRSQVTCIATVCLGLIEEQNETRRLLNWSQLIYSVQFSTCAVSYIRFSSPFVLVCFVTATGSSTKLQVTN